MVQRATHLKRVYVSLRTSIHWDGFWGALRSVWRARVRGGRLRALPLGASGSLPRRRQHQARVDVPHAGFERLARFLFHKPVPISGAARDPPQVTRGWCGRGAGGHGAHVGPWGSRKGVQAGVDAVSTQKELAAALSCSRCSCGIVHGPPGFLLPAPRGWHVRVLLGVALDEQHPPRQAPSAHIKCTRRAALFVQDVGWHSAYSPP